MATGERMGVRTGGDGHADGRVDRSDGWRSTDGNRRTDGRTGGRTTRLPDGRRMGAPVDGRMGGQADVSGRACRQVATANAGRLT